MQKPLPPQTARCLNPPANVFQPYTFFESVRDHPFQPENDSLNLRNAWWLADAALLAYSNDADVRGALQSAGISGEVAFFRGSHSTQAYAVSMPDAIVLAFRGTQVDDFWSSVLDFAVDVQFLPAANHDGNLVHGGFQTALGEVWSTITAHVAREQTRNPRPLWITGHSLGAALATLAANLCTAEPALRLKGVYTFGSPRVGDPGFGARILVPVFRFRHDADIVPHVPIGLVFRHVGHLQFIDSGGRLHSNVSSTMELMLDPGAHLISAREVLMLKHAIGRDGVLDPLLPGFLGDHAPINYSILVWNAYDRSR